MPVLQIRRLKLPTIKWFAQDHYSGHVSGALSANGKSPLTGHLALGASCRSGRVLRNALQCIIFYHNPSFPFFTSGRPVPSLSQDSAHKFSHM